MDETNIVIIVQHLVDESERLGVFFALRLYPKTPCASLNLTAGAHAGAVI